MADSLVENDDALRYNRDREAKKYRKPSKKHSRKVAKNIEEWKKKKAEKEQNNIENESNSRNETNEDVSHIHQVEQIVTDTANMERSGKRKEKQTTAERIQKEWMSKHSNEESNVLQPVGRGRPITKSSSPVEEKVDYPEYSLFKDSTLAPVVKMLISQIL